MGLAEDYRSFIQSSQQIRQELQAFEDSINSLDIEDEYKQDVLEAIEDFSSRLYGVKMNVTDVETDLYEKGNFFFLHSSILETILSERQLEQAFQEFNRKMEKLQTTRMSRFLSNELDYGGQNTEELAIKTLKRQTEKSSTHIKWARKKNYLSYKSSYNAFEAEKEFEKIARFEEQKGRAIAEELKEEGFSYGEQILEERPVILIHKNALRKAVETTRKASIEEIVTETAGAFNMKRLGDRKMLLYDFENWDSADTLSTTGIKEEHYEKMWGESGRELIFWHCHPKASDLEKGARFSDRLSAGDVDILTDTISEGYAAGERIPAGEKSGIREGMTILSTPWDHRDIPKEDIVWMACAVSSQGGTSGFFNMHVVEGDPDNGFDIVDGGYSWPSIYNKWIKAAMAGSENIGPYSQFWETKTLENKLGYN